MERVIYLILSFCLFVPLFLRRALLIAVVEGGSMKPALLPGNRMLVWTLGVRRWLKKDAIVVIDSSQIPSVATPLHRDDEILEITAEGMKPDSGFERSTGLTYEELMQVNQTPTSQIKRVAGLAGDWVEEANLVVPEGHCFVLGDNPDESADSRVYGAIPLGAIRGIGIYQFNSDSHS